MPDDLAAPTHVLFRSGAGAVEPMSQTRFTTYMGMQIEPQADGEVVVRLALGPQHRNGRGVVHGGVVAALLDTALGGAVVAAIPREWWCATTSLSVQFIAGTRSAELVARGRVLRRGRSTAFASGTAHDGDGTLVASAQGSWHLWPHHPDARVASSDHFVVVKGSGERLRVGKILAVGRNYREHVREMGGEPDAIPVVFLKPASALLAGGGVVRIPAGLGAVHHEVEMVAVIGRGGRAIEEGEALSHVLGYAVGLDLTLRDLQAKAKSRGEPWTLAKGFDTSAPVSLVALREEVGDGAGLALTLDVNGERRQEASTSDMTRTVAALIAHVSRHVTLEPGDLIFTGTPAGVGPVRAGDLLEARLEKVGSLSVRVEEDSE